MKMAKVFKINSHYQFDCIIEFVIQITCLHIDSCFFDSFTQAYFILITYTCHPLLPPYLICYSLILPTGVFPPSCIFSLVLARSTCVAMSLESSNAACEQAWRKTVEKFSPSYRICQQLIVAERSRTP